MPTRKWERVVAGEWSESKQREEDLGAHTV